MAGREMNRVGCDAGLLVSRKAWPGFGFESKNLGPPGFGPVAGEDFRGAGYSLTGMPRCLTSRRRRQARVISSSRRRTSVRIEILFRERAFDDDRFKFVGHDELGLHRVAADVPFGGREERAGFDFAAG